jgi:hypothetical protein
MCILYETTNIRQQSIMLSYNFAMMVVDLYVLVGN